MPLVPMVIERTARGLVAAPPARRRCDRFRRREQTDTRLHNSPLSRAPVTEDIDIAWEIDAYRFDLPLMSAPVDSVASPAIAPTSTAVKSG